jgi:aspartate-semialdehyde dehydrogenase
MKVVWETLKIFNMKDEDLRISCTAVRVPVLRAHSESVTIETVKSICSADVRNLLSDIPGVRVVDSPHQNLYPMPITASETFDVEVGRIRQSLIFGEYGLDLFVCGDQLLRGAALNAVLIAEMIIKLHHE